ncbi:GYD domain-containing protein [Natronobiforma cellulositropha]|uniref:GYD domain-containing protein n=1 Tax=Natronobiforma cellulositropha TaxID=1679076 RepID=UPI0021D5E24F|nr:GYD domain-containing protein [Natronobiforma cellulositropha]
MPTYASLVDATDREVHTAQELASIWGEIDREFTELGVELRESYAILGSHDFLVTFEAPDHETGFKSALTLRRHGLSAETMQVLDTDAFAHVVDDI